MSWMATNVLWSNSSKTEVVTPDPKHPRNHFSSGVALLGGLNPIRAVVTVCDNDVLRISFGRLIQHLL